MKNGRISSSIFQFSLFTFHYSLNQLRWNLIDLFNGDTSDK